MPSLGTCMRTAHVSHEDIPSERCRPHQGLVPGSSQVSQARLWPRGCSPGLGSALTAQQLRPSSPQRPGGLNNVLSPSAHTQATDPANFFQFVLFWSLQVTVPTGSVSQAGKEGQTLLCLRQLYKQLMHYSWGRSPARLLSARPCATPQPSLTPGSRQGRLSEKLEDRSRAGGGFMPSPSHLPQGQPFTSVHCTVEAPK